MVQAARSKVAIIGDGIVAAFAAHAVSVTGLQPVVFSPTGAFTVPPHGAFYLHQLPPRIAGQYSSLPSITTRLGDDAQAYSQKMWGKPQPTSSDSFEHKSIAYEFQPEMMLAMFEGAEIRISGMVNHHAVRQLAEEYHGVVVTAPISFVEKERPDTKQFVIARAISRNRFYDAVVEQEAAFSSKHGAGLSHAFARSQSVHDEIARITGEYGQSIATVYSGSMQHMWLRCTYHPRDNSVDIELPYALFDMRFWKTWKEHMDWTDGKLYQLFQEMRTSLKWLRGNMMVARKISPTETARNQSPADNVLLTGRWATWERGELSHQTYQRTLEWLQNI